MKKMTMILSAALCTALAAAPARAQFGGFSKPSMPSTSLPSASGGDGATPEQVERFMKDTSDADELVRTSSLHLLSAVGSKSEVDQINSRIQAANGIADAKEKSAKMDSVQKDINTQLQKIDFNKVNEELKSKADEKKNASIRSGVFNLALGSLKDADLVASGKKLVSGTPSPMVADRIPDVKDSVTRLASQSEALNHVVGNSKILMTTVGLKDLPASASETPKAVEGD